MLESKNYEQESGRSMVEMLGVLAIIGVLSVGGISGYTTAMNKHKANEILNAAAVRAMAVSTQLQSGTPIGSVSLGEFDNENSVGGAIFAAGVTDAGNNRFTIGFANNGKPSDAVLAQMQNIAGTDGIVRDLTGTGITYNNDLTADKIASDYKNQADCGTYATTGRTWCSGVSKCAEGNDCCSVMPYDAQCQTCSSGSVSNITDGTSCNYGDGTDNGQCSNGECKEAKICNPTCGAHATCTPYSGGVYCKCDIGYYGDGFTCTATTASSIEECLALSGDERYGWNGSQCIDCFDAGMNYGRWGDLGCACSGGTKPDGSCCPGGESGWNGQICVHCNGYGAGAGGTPETACQCGDAGKPDGSCCDFGRHWDSDQEKCV